MRVCTRFCCCYYYCDYYYTLHIYYDYYLLLINTSRRYSSWWDLSFIFLIPTVYNRSYRVRVRPCICTDYNVILLWYVLGTYTQRLMRFSAYSRAYTYPDPLQQSRSYYIKTQILLYIIIPRAQVIFFSPVGPSGSTAEMYIIKMHIVCLLYIFYLPL